MLHQYELISTRLLPNVSTQPISSTAITCIRSGSDWKNSVIRPVGNIFKSEKTDIWQYWGFFRNVRLRKKTKFLRTYNDAPEDAIIHEKRLLFTPSFLRTAFELRYYGGLFQIPKTLTVFPILPWDSKTFELCEEGDIEAFKQALSRREISPLARNQSGGTLLHLASECCNAELCSLLIQLDVDPNHIDDWGGKALYLANYSSVFQMDTIRILATAQDDLTFEDLSYVFDDQFSGSHEIEDFLLSTYGFLEKVDYTSKEGISLLGVALRNYGSGRREWGTSIRKWLRRKADIHARSLPKRVSRGECVL